MSTPYTYLIGWTCHNLWYYGVRYSKNCDPDDLWISYFTSSKKVIEYRKKLGEPDIKQIRKIFNSPKAAKLWEDKVLARMKVRDNPKWINLSNNYSFAAIDKSWNEGLTKETDIRLQNIANKISQKRKEFPWVTGKYIRTKEQNSKNRMSQILNNRSNFPFNNYESLSEYCDYEFKFGKSITEISKYLKIDATTVKLAIEYKSGAVPSINQSWTKIKKNNPNLPFTNYLDLCTYLKNEITIKGRKKSHLQKELGISADAINRAIHSLIASHY